MPEEKTDFKQVSDAEWQEAVRRERVIRPISELSRIGLPHISDAVEKLDIGRSQIYDLIARYRENPVTSSLLTRKPGPVEGMQRLPAQVEKIIKQSVESYYLTRQKPTIANLHKNIRHDCILAGVIPPSLKAIRARVSSINLKEKVKKREGGAAARDLFRPIKGHYDKAQSALEIVQIDHTLADVILVDELYRQPIGRPWVTFAIDIASRMIAGIFVTLEKPSAISVAMTVRNIVLPKDDWLASMGIEAPWPVSGLPEKIHVDNAKEFRSQALRRGCAEYGIELQYRPVGQPHFGGHIERLIGTMMGAVHLLPGTTFSNIAEKGDYDSEKQAVMTLIEFETWLTVEIVGKYHAEVHSSIAMPPLNGWREALERRSSPLRHPKDNKQFLYDFLPCENRKVRRDGIRLFNIHYWDSILSVWAGHEDEPMSVKYDPRDLSTVFLQAPDGVHWPIRYRNLRRPRITLWEHRQALKSLKESGRRSVDEQMVFDAVETQRILVSEAKVRTKKARTIHQKTSHALEAAYQTQLESSEEPEALVTEDIQEDIEESIPPYEVEEWS